jgi:hypothetical protein
MLVNQTSHLIHALTLSVQAKGKLRAAFLKERIWKLWRACKQVSLKFWISGLKVTSNKSLLPDELPLVLLLSVL